MPAANQLPPPATRISSTGVLQEAGGAGESTSSILKFPSSDRATGFFFQAEDGIRDYKVTGVQTCALPIYPRRPPLRQIDPALEEVPDRDGDAPDRLRVEREVDEIGRASCRERV